ncbi:MAG: hypothetical protein IKU14_00490 [Rhodocyclaceae bacterium]|nr:hypothetical protein [Rhodocyclaceae bacterium]
MVSAEGIKRKDVALAEQLGNAKSEKVYLGDAVQAAQIGQGSSTELAHIPDASLDLVITDPPFGGLLHYSELSDFFYVWLRLALKDKYPDIFGAEYTPKSLEAVANKAREPEDPDGFYQRLLTQCWREAHRVLKPGGVFLTQQVGAENDRALTQLLLGNVPLPFPENTLSNTVERFGKAGFTILEAQEAFRPIRFYDVAALVWFAHVIEWEFPNFSVKKCLPQLLAAQKILEENGCI